MQKGWFWCILLPGVIFSMFTDFANYFAIGCTLVGASLLGVMKFLSNSLKSPASSNLHREISGHRLHTFYVGMEVDRYIRFIRLHILLFWSLIISVIITIWALVLCEQYDFVFQLFLGMAVLAAITAYCSEKTSVGEKFTALESVTLIGSFVFGCIVFSIMFLVFTETQSIGIWLAAFFVSLLLMYLFYKVPLDYYNNKIRTAGKKLFVDRFIGRRTPSLEIHLCNGKVLDFNQKLFYPIFDNSSLVTVLYPGEIGYCYIQKESIKCIIYDGEDVTKEFLPLGDNQSRQPVRREDGVC